MVWCSDRSVLDISLPVLLLSRFFFLFTTFHFGIGLGGGLPIQRLEISSARSGLSVRRRADGAEKNSHIEEGPLALNGFTKRSYTTHNKRNARNQNTHAAYFC
eukprot:6136798-Pyramimonas_sp.AAC.1